MTRLARADKQARASALANALGARNGALLSAVPAPPDGDGQTSAELWLYGVVGGYYWGFNDKTVADQLRGLSVDHITVRLNSPGGDAIQGVAIGNLLRNHKAHVTVVVDGLAASAASIIAIAGDEVVLSPGSQMMIHDPWFFTMGNAKELRQDADFLDKQGANLASVYALRGDGDAASWRAAMTAEPDGTWYTADEAVTAKLADRVGTVVAVGTAPEPPALELDTENDDMAARAAWDLDVLIAPAARAAWSAHAPKPPAASAPGSINTPEGEPAMAFTPEQLTQMRKDLGLSADADEATIVAALSEAASSAEIAPPATPQIPEGMVLVDSTMFTQLQAGVKDGQTAAATLAEQARDKAFNDALAAGKISADTAKTLRAKVEEKPETWAATEALLAALTPGLVPTAEIGHGDDSEDADSAFEAAHAAVLAKHGITKGA